MARSACSSATSGDEPDGIVGPHTLSVLRRMRPLDAVPSRALVREREELEASRGPIEGRVIAIDVGEGGATTCTSAPGGRSCEELRAVGADAAAHRMRTTEAAAPSDRARLANEAGAAASITVELTARDEEGGGGPVCSYFGSRTTHSPSGLVLAQLILEELEAELGLAGAGAAAHDRAAPRDRMPAVQVEPMTGTGPRTDELRSDPDLPTRVARAVAAGVGRFFSGRSPAPREHREDEAQDQPEERCLDGALPLRRVPPRIVHQGRLPGLGYRREVDRALPHRDRGGVVEFIFAGFLVFFIANIVLVIWALVDAIRVPDDSMYRAGNKLIWILVVLLAGFVGAIMYFFVGKPASGGSTTGASWQGQPPPPPPGSIG